MRLAAVVLLGSLMANAQTSFDSLLDRYFADRFRFSPTEGTAAGFHQYDNQFEDYSPQAIQARIDLYRSYLPQFQNLPQTPERDLVIARINADLLELRQIGSWQRNPDFYSSGATASIFGLISRKFAPPAERLASVIAREEKIPEALAMASINLVNPPRIYTEVALEQLPGIQNFFRSDVPAAFQNVHDADLLARFKKTNDGVLAALASYEQFLRNDLLPRSKGDFRIGPTNYRSKLLFEEMVDIPLDRLLKIGYDDLHANQRALIALAKTIDPGKTPEQVAESLGHNHPAPDALLQTFRDTLGGLVDFIQAHHIITIPSDVRPILEETPPFMRALTTASMDTPGPYEKVATEAYFNVTLPQKSWSPKETEEFMSAFSRGTIISTAIHEAYPGHYVQLLWFQKLHSKARKLLGCGTNIEGWAHYTEQMMLDQGYGNNDPALRVGQLMDALLRDCRYIVGIEMHTGQMTYEQGIDFFVKQGYMTHAYAERETKRGTSDPTYLVYTLGKLEILKLRQDYEARQGAAFRLEEFHDRFMQQGGVPIKLIRKAILGDDSPAL
jgi:uncharacterized protein (DUF885 family)